MRKISTVHRNHFAITPTGPLRRMQMGHDKIIVYNKFKTIQGIVMSSVDAYFHICYSCAERGRY